jgi:hypothetical protein
MANIMTLFTLGDTIEFTDADGNDRKEMVIIIRTELVQGFGLWVLYGYGDLYRPDYVSEDQILKSKKVKHASNS